MTDFYSECEDGLAVMLRTLTQFFKKDWQVSDDDTVLANGAEYFAIVRPGAFPYDRETIRVAIVSWNVTMDLYVSYKEYKTSWDRFKAFRSAIFNLLMENPDLGGTAGVLRVSMMSDEQAKYLKFSDVPDAKPNFIIQTVKVVIDQYVRIPDANF